MTAVAEVPTYGRCASGRSGQTPLQTAGVVAELSDMSIFDYVVIAGLAAGLAAVLTWALGPRWPLAAVLCAPIWWLLELVFEYRRPRWDGSQSAAMLWNVALVLLAVGGGGQLLERL